LVLLRVVPAEFRSNLAEGGDLDFEAFFAAHYERTRRILAVMFGDPEIGEEAAQEGFYRAYRRWSRVQKMNRPDSWVLVVGLNYGRDLLRRRSRKEDLSDLSTHSSQTDRDMTDSISVAAEIVRLPPRQQQAIALRYMLDMSLEEVAKSMKCALGTAKSTLHSALENLRIQLTESADI
jgi:RNA polymerase sigma-70 factor (ECF subfamily)